jgi:hypothetical protein
VNNWNIPAPLRLLRTPVPKPDESLMGYILRLTEENGYDTPSWIFDLAGLNATAYSGGWSAHVNKSLDFTSLEQLLGLEHSEFEHIRSRLTELKYHIGFRAPKVCPACLEQASYYRCVWDLFPFTACPAHSTVLIDKCQRCNKRISWARKKVSVCHCGFDWRGSNLIKATPLALEAPRQLLKLCGFSSDRSGSHIKKRNPLYDLKLRELCQILTLIASYYRLIKEGRHITTETENIICNDYYSYAFAAFNDWPKNFYAVFNWARWKKKGTKVHEALHHKMCQQFESSSLHFAIVAIEAYLKDHHNDACLSLFLLRERRFVNKKEACWLLGIEQKWLDALIRRGKLKITRQGGRNTEVLLEPHNILKLEIELAKLLDIRQAARLLDIEVKDVEELVSLGYLRPASGPLIDGFPEWKFDVDGIDVLLEMVRERVVDLMLTPSDMLISAGVVIHAMERHGLSVGHFVNTIMEGKIVPLEGEIGLLSWLPRQGLSCFAFSKEQVMEYLRVRT